MLMFCNSFDHYNDLSLKWTTPGGTISFGPGARTGPGSLVIQGILAPTLGFAGVSGIVCGCAFNTQTLSGRPLSVDPATLHVGINGDGSFSLDDVTGTVARSAGGLIQTGQYNYFEMKAQILSPSHGVATVRLNGVTLMNAVNWTPNSGNTTFTSFGLVGPGAGLSANVDDLYICDLSGSTNNDFLGAIRIYAVVPSANGTPVNWTPNGAATNFQCVNSVPPGTPFVSGAAVNVTDQYIYDVSSVPAGLQIFGLQHILNAQLASAGSRQIASIVNGIVGPPSAPTTTEKMMKTPYDKNPATGLAWTTSDFPATELGVTITV